MPIPALITALGGLATAGLNAMSTERTNERNRELQQEMNNRNIRLQREANAYNSPVSQMQRFFDAGINPMYAVGQGMVDAGNQQSLPEQHMMQYEAPSFGAIGDSLQSSVSQALQSQMNEQKIRESVQKILESASRTDNVNFKTNVARTFFQYQPTIWQNAVKQSEKILGEIDSRIGVNLSVSSLNDSQRKFVDTQRANLFRTWRVMDATTAESWSRVKLNWQQCKLFDAQERNWMIKNDVDFTTGIYTKAYWSTRNGALDASLFQIQEGFSVLNAAEQNKILKETGIGLSINNQFNPDFFKWRNETQRAQSGILWDEWQQGQARKNYETYVLGTGNMLSGFLQGGSQVYKALGGSASNPSPVSTSVVSPGAYDPVENAAWRAGFL